MSSCLHVTIAFHRVSECIYKPCFDHILRTLGIPARKETLEGLVWLSESIKLVLLPLSIFGSFETVRAVKLAYVKVFQPFSA